jgi:hypothetical protein
VRDTREAARFQYADPTRYGNFIASSVGDSNPVPSLARVTDRSRQKHDSERRGKALQQSILHQPQKFAIVPLWHIGGSKNAIVPVGLLGHKRRNLAAGLGKTQQRQYGDQ